MMRLMKATDEYGGGVATYYMTSGKLQKFIVVYPDGRCTVEECNSGNFYVDQAGGWVDGKDYETAFVEELMAHVDATYRTRAAAEVEVSR